MQVVCRIFRGQFELSLSIQQLRLEDFYPFATTVYRHRPSMIRYRSRNITLLLFTNFKFRLMGKGEAHIEVLREFLAQLPWGSDMKIRNLRLSTMTLTHCLPMSVNTHKLCQNHDKFRAEWELFPAVQWLGAGGGVHVNIFHTGKVVATGVKSINEAESRLLPRLYRDIQHALRRGCAVLPVETTESTERGHLHASSAAVTPR